MLSITDWIVNRGVSPVFASKLIIYLLPDMFLLALPAASLISVLIAFQRLSEDNEIIALKSSGISLFQLLPQILSFSLFCLLLSLLISFFGIPWGNKSLKNTIYQIAQEEGGLALKERLFSEPIDDVVFYINEISPIDRTMKDIFVVDRRDKSITNTIVAGRGQIIRHPKAESVTLHFEDGNIFMVEEDLDSARTVSFVTYDLNIKLKDILNSRTLNIKAPKEMSAGELIDGIGKEERGSTRYNELSIRLVEKYAVPFAVFLMALMAAPLGGRIRSSKRFIGFVLGLAIFLIYYLCFMAARNLSETGVVSPYLGIWIPDFLLIVFCFLLWLRETKGGSIGLLETLPLYKRFYDKYLLVKVIKS